MILTDFFPQDMRSEDEKGRERERERDNFGNSKLTVISDLPGAARLR